SKVTLTATITNDGSLAAGASETEFRLGDGTLIGIAATGGIAPGATTTASVLWDTRSTSGEYRITATADLGDVVDESNEGNNAGTLTVTVRGNKVQNGSFEQASSDGSAPANWTASDSGAGTTSWSQGGSDGQRSATVTGNGGNAALSGVPTWTSDPIAVTAGQVLTLTASVRVEGASSAPSIGLAYLGPAGELLQTVTVLTAPLSTSGFAALEQAVTIPAGVVEVRVVLLGFAATDSHTAGTVTFDEIGIFEE
ncbi:MAG: CARDB domain-containing protein, partial [Candidatus Limnocylindria bacterium]